MSQVTMESIVSLCKRRGFIFPSDDLYDGLKGVFDYGPIGVELKNNLRHAWWQANVHERDDMEGLDGAILTHRKVMQHSGHEATFSDPMVDCRQCKSRHRADHLKNGQCEHCGSTDLTDPRPFNMMFKTLIGPIEDPNSFAYLRPETAQSIFTNFRHIVDASARQLPFGIAQVGKAFRNEITPRHFIFRSREFEQMELEYFVDPKEAKKWHEYWVENRYQWWLDQGLASERLSLQPQKKEELAHYAQSTVDILYAFPHGDEELEGIANRGDFDLGTHTKEQNSFKIDAQVKENNDSNAKLAIRSHAQNQWVMPYVIEPSAGLDRGVLAVLTEAYHEENLPQDKKRVVLKLKPHLSPIKATIVPLARNHAPLVQKAKDICQILRQSKIGRIGFENTGNIGKAYRRHDEIGTPFCITVDFETLGEESATALKDTVTIRHRDTMQQERISITQLTKFLQERLH